MLFSRNKKDIRSINQTNQLQNATLQVVLTRIEKLEKRVEEMESVEQKLRTAPRSLGTRSL